MQRTYNQNSYLNALLRAIWFKRVCMGRLKTDSINNLAKKCMLSMKTIQTNLFENQAYMFEYNKDRDGIPNIMACVDVNFNEGYDTAPSSSVDCALIPVFFTDAEKIKIASNKFTANNAQKRFFDFLYDIKHSDFDNFYNSVYYKPTHGYLSLIQLPFFLASICPSVHIKETINKNVRDNNEKLHALCTNSLALLLSESSRIESEPYLKTKLSLWKLQLKTVFGKVFMNHTKENIKFFTHDSKLLYQSPLVKLNSLDSLLNIHRKLNNAVVYSNMLPPVFEEIMISNIRKFITIDTFYSDNVSNFARQQKIILEALHEQNIQIDVAKIIIQYTLNFVILANNPIKYTTYEVKHYATDTNYIIGSQTDTKTLECIGFNFAESKCFLKMENKIHTELFKNSQFSNVTFVKVKAEDLGAKESALNVYYQINKQSLLAAKYVSHFITKSIQETKHNKNEKKNALFRLLKFSSSGADKSDEKLLEEIQTSGNINLNLLLIDLMQLSSSKLYNLDLTKLLGNQNMTGQINRLCNFLRLLQHIQVYKSYDVILDEIKLTFDEDNFCGSCSYCLKKYLDSVNIRFETNNLLVTNFYSSFVLLKHFLPSRIAIKLSTLTSTLDYKNNNTLFFYGLGCENDGEEQVYITYSKLKNNSDVLQLTRLCPNKASLSLWNYRDKQEQCWGLQRNTKTWEDIYNYRLDCVEKYGMLYKKAVGGRKYDVVVKEVKSTS